MSSTTETDIRAALTARLAAMTGLPDVAWENTTYTPVLGTPYLKPNLIPGEPDQAELGDTGRNWERGIYQVRICNYPTNTGLAAINAMSDRLRDWFKRGTRLTYNGITVTIRKAYSSPEDYSDSAGVQKVVSIAYYSQVAN